MLIVEDILVTGSSVRAVADVVRELGGVVIGVSAICNRGDATADSLGVPKLEHLVEMKLGTWSADECPLCLKRVPVRTDIGHGKEFLDGNERMLTGRTAAIAAGTTTPGAIADHAETRKHEKQR